MSEQWDNIADMMRTHHAVKRKPFISAAAFFAVFLCNYDSMGGWLFSLQILFEQNVILKQKT